jgi:hypothetical protein
MAKRILPKAYIALWMLLLVVLGCYYLFFAPRDSEYSQVENRTLAAFPEVTAQSVFSGDFGREIETYLLDRFPIRETAINTMNRMESALSLATHDEYLLIAEDVDDPLVDDDYQADLEELLAQMNTKPSHTPTQSTESTETTEIEPIETEPVEDPPIVEKPASSLDDYPWYLGMYMDVGYGQETLRDYHRNNVLAVTAVLNKYAALLPENGKLMFTVGPPSYLVNRFVNAENKVSFHNTWDELINGMSADNVYAFDSGEILSAAVREGEYVAFRTDNHWTPYGAYLIYSQMAAQAGKALCSYPNDFNITTEEPFRGTYYRNDPSAYWNVQPDVLERVAPKIDVEYRKITGPDTYEVIDFIKLDAAQNDRYTVYLGGPGGPWRYAECDNDQTENCLVITDSFGLTVIPYLTSNYKQIHYYDARYFDRYVVGHSVAEMIEKYHIQDIYVIVADFHSFDSSFLLSDVNEQLNGW